MTRRARRLCALDVPRRVVAILERQLRLSDRDKMWRCGVQQPPLNLVRARAAHDPRNHRRFTATRAPFPRRPLRTTLHCSRLAERASIRRASSPATGARSG